MQRMRDHLQTLLRRFSAKIRDLRGWFVQIRVRIVLKSWVSENNTYLHYACGYGTRLPQTELVSISGDINGAQTCRLLVQMGARVNSWGFVKI